MADPPQGDVKLLEPSLQLLPIGLKEAALYAIPYNRTEARAGSHSPFLCLNAVDKVHADFPILVF
jgi:hypothetical protein